MGYLCKWSHCWHMKRRYGFLLPRQKLQNGIYTGGDWSRSWKSIRRQSPNANVYGFFMRKHLWIVVALPEHLNSWSCKSATFCPFSWPGEWQRVYGASRGALRRNFESHDRWQSHANGLSERRNARNRGMLENISRGIVVMLLLLSVKISNSWRFLTAISSMHTIWLWSSWRLRSAGTPLNIRFDIAAISLFDKSLWRERLDKMGTKQKS